MSFHPSSPAQPFRIAVLGTDTNVGKTTLTVALTRALVARLPGCSVQALKPVETGGVSDAAALGAVSSPAHPPDHAYQFPDPVSPHLAARRVGGAVTAQGVLDWIAAREAAAPQPAVTLIETAGGAFSPLARGLTNAACVRFARPDYVILVAADRLGVLNQVTTTLRALTTEQLAVDAVVLSAAPPSDHTTGLNAAELTELDILESPYEFVEQVPEPLLESLAARVQPQGRPSAATLTRP